jgi:hypothetical protein
MAHWVKNSKNIAIDQNASGDPDGLPERFRDSFGNAGFSIARVTI